MITGIHGDDPAQLYAELCEVVEEVIDHFVAENRPLPQPRIRPIKEARLMQTVKFVYWQEDDGWLGYLEEYPDYWTQGETLEDLKEHLQDLYLDLCNNLFGETRK